MNKIPPMTDPLGKYWEQPDRENILIDDTHAVMSEKDFKKLKEYSLSIPDGVYEGKMWQRTERYKDATVYRLVWYVDRGVPGQMGIEYRTIILL